MYGVLILVSHWRFYTREKFRMVILESAFKRHSDLLNLATKRTMIFRRRNLYFNM
jgi:hypothetical protein